MRPMNTTMRNAGSLLLLVLAAACGGKMPARAPLAAGAASKELLAAFDAEARGTPADAVERTLRVLESTASAPSTAETNDVVLAALDALVHRRAVPSVSRPSALAARTADGGKLDARLARIEEGATGPFARGLVAEARLALAERRGDAAAAKDARARTGCAREATLFGPVAYDTVQGTLRAPLAGTGKEPLPASVAAPSPFLAPIAPIAITAMGCSLPLHAATPARGVREVVVDVDVTEAGPVGLAMRSGGPAVLHAGGVVAATRPFSAGSSDVLSLGVVDVDRPGALRVVARVGLDREHGVVEIHAWDAQGRPLAAHAAAAGSRAEAHVARTLPIDRRGGDAVVTALGRLAAGDPAEAEATLHPEIASNPRPEALLAYARAVQRAPDLPDVKAQERARGAVSRLLEAWPDAWEAIVLHAELAGARRGQAEAPVETLAALREQRAKAGKVAGSAWVDAYEAVVAGRAMMLDDAHGAAERARGPLGSTPLWHEVERAAFERTGKEAIAFECEGGPTRDFTTLDCHRERFAAGDRDGAERELERLRALADAPQLYLSLSVRDAIERGDTGRAQSLLARMAPGDRSLSMTYSALGAGMTPAAVLAQAPTSRDAPSAIPALLRAAGDDPLAAFEGVAERVTASAAGPSLAGAATAVLAHDERYEVTANGVLHVRILDVRRVMGTADVEANAQAPAPMLYGKDSLRILRRRIFKKDGRIVLPDETPNAAQSHADLSQLEAGDAVEAIYEGFGIPGDAGNLGFDTPDLLPERTTVRDARIQITLPASLKVSLWSHPMLGTAEEKREGTTRTLVYKLEDRPVRRLEMGVPKMDRAVGVSLSTTTWDDVAKGLRDAIAALDDTHPEVTSWARESAAGKAPSRELVASVVEASGKVVKEASGMALADIDLGRAASAGAGTARTSLVTHEGSRTWLVVRALHELGVKTDIVLAENEPFSHSPTFPPHFGRFMHALAVAHLEGGDVWIDADVPGPPLPAGRVSPELRGRLALWPDGRIAPLPAEVTQAAERDEVDMRLTVDDAGNARGVLTVLLRGRAAQDIAEALERIVGLERQRALRGIALAWVPSATVEKVELSSSEGSWQIAIRAELSCPAYAQVEGRKQGARTWSLPGLDPLHYVFPRPFVTTLSSTYAASGARDSALAINRATQYHARRRVELPKGATVARVPGPFAAKGPLLAARRQIAVSGNTIEDDFVLDVTTGTVPRESYDAFVAEARRTDDAFRASTRVAPAPK